MSDRLLPPPTSRPHTDGPGADAPEQAPPPPTSPQPRPADPGAPPDLPPAASTSSNSPAGGVDPHPADTASSDSLGPLRPGQEPEERSRGIGWRGLTAAVAAGAVGAAAVVVPTIFIESDPEPEAVSANDSTATSATNASSTPVGAISREVSPSVARVDALGSAGVGAGSAVVYDSDGTLVTNAHVVANASEVTVTLPDGERLDAQVVGADARSDLAVLQVDETDLPVPHWASNEAEGTDVGDQVVAIGSPFGLDGTVTAGIVSAVGRTVEGPDGPLVDMLQTDAAINPGNSGGALANSSGEVIGLNTAIFSSSGGNDGVGFAIPASTVHHVVDQLMTHGSVQHASLGVAGQTVDPDVAQLYGLGVDSGAAIAQIVEGGPADQAGLETGDIVVAIDGDPIASMNDLAAAVQASAPGDSLTLEFIRQGESHTIEVELDERD